MNLIEALALAVIQSITEWLPVSSSGHLAIAQQLFGLKENLTYDIVLHLATLVVIVLVFYKEIIETLQDKRRFLFIIIGTLPIVLLGYILNPVMQDIFNSMLIVGISLLLTATILYLSDKATKAKIQSCTALGIGFFQALALLPGVSRSGATIGGALILGINKKDAISFSFILAIPAILGATVLKAGEIAQGITLNMVIGFFVTIIISYFVLKWLIKLVQENKLKYFAYYCLILGVILILTAVF